MQKQAELTTEPMQVPEGPYVPAHFLTSMGQVLMCLCSLRLFPSPSVAGGQGRLQAGLAGITLLNITLLYLQCSPQLAPLVDLLCS